MRMKFISMNRLETGTLVYSEKRTGVRARRHTKTQSLTQRATESEITRVESGNPTRTARDGLFSFIDNSYCERALTRLESDSPFFSVTSSQSV